MRHIVLASCVLAAVGSAARADGVLDEASAGNTQATASAPSSAWIADKVAGIYEPSDAWQIRLDFTTTHDAGSAPSAMARFGSSSNNIYLANLSAEWDPGDWSFKLVGGYSPSATTTATTTVPFQSASGSLQADAQLQSTGDTASAAAWAGWDSGLLGAFNTAVLATATANEFDTQQQLTQIDDRKGHAVSIDQIQMYCGTHACGPQLTSVLGAQETHLAQYVLDANVTQTLWGDTDVGVDAAYYVYNEDPAKVGYYSIAAVGRTASFGNGPSLAPLLYTVMPNAIHRFGALMLLASMTYGQYVDDEGTDITAALRVQYRWRLSRESRLKVYGKLSASRDTEQGETIGSGTLALGAQYTW